MSRGPFHGHVSPWRDGRLDARFAELIAEKRSGGAIAEILGVTRSAVMGRAHRLGLQLISKPSGNPKPHRKHRPQPKPVPVPVRAVPKLKPPPKPVCVAPPVGTVTLLDLQPHQCRWPFGDGPFTFCGAMRAWPGPYCPHHTRLGTT